MTRSRLSDWRTERMSSFSRAECSLTARTGKSTSMKRFTRPLLLMVITKLLDAEPLASRQDDPAPLERLRRRFLPTYWQTPNPHPAPIKDDDAACPQWGLNLR